MFCGGWNYSRGNPCGGFANILQLFPEMLLLVRQSFTATGGHAGRFRGFKFIFNEKVSPTHQNLLYLYYKNPPPNRGGDVHKTPECLQFRETGRNFSASLR